MLIKNAFLRSMPSQTAMKPTQKTDSFEVYTDNEKQMSSNWCYHSLLYSLKHFTTFLDATMACLYKYP